MGFGYVVKELLRTRGMTIKQLAEEAKIPVNTLYSITKRDSVRVDPVVAARVCKALNVSTGELLSLQPSVDTPENRQSIESGLTAFLEAADEYAKKKHTREESIKQAWQAAELKAGKKLSFDEAMSYYKFSVDRKMKLDKALSKLNDEGIRVALERIEELTLIDKYTLPVITDKPQDTSDTSEDNNT